MYMFVLPFRVGMPVLFFSVESILLYHFQIYPASGIGARLVHSFRNAIDYDCLVCVTGVHRIGGSLAVMSGGSDCGCRLRFAACSVHSFRRVMVVMRIYEWFVKFPILRCQMEPNKKEGEQPRHACACAK